MSITVRQSARSLSETQVNRVEHLIVAVVGTEEPAWNELPYGKDLATQYQREAKLSGKPVLVTDLPNGKRTHVSLALVNPDSGSFELLSRARKLVGAHTRFDPEKVVVQVAGSEDAAARRRCGEALVSALLASAADLPNRSKSHKPPKLASIALQGITLGSALGRAQAEATGNNLARHLSMLPPNDLVPKTYVQRAMKLAKQYGWKAQFFDEAALKKKRAGAFLAVCQGSPNRDAGILKLSYTPGSRAKQRVALVGKGICYDTGGVNLKPANYMRGMHEDMEGSAVALGTLVALSELEVPFAVDAWLALAMNHIGPSSYQPNDIVTAADGTTIEVIHTDAEGRMVLADTLIMASGTKPDLILDYATLTGSCVAALGKSYSGVFTNRMDWITTLIEAGKESGERVWPFPMDPDFDKGIESSVADTKQCAEGGAPDHILAARFLQKFVKHDVPWVHMDLSSGNTKGGLGHIASDCTGFGVRLSLNLLLEKKLASAS